MLDPRWYDGREQALVKHTFLDTYMPAQIPKIVSWANEFTYVDLFAGPWQSKSGDYSDTSFGIALRRMTEAKAKQAELGRKVTMVAHLVEKDPANFAELIDAVKRFPDVEIHCHPGQAEDHASAIATAIPARAFRFVVIDPKGVPDVRKFRCLISPDRTEVLMNFVINTDRRTYHVELRATAAAYMASVSWTYPADELIALQLAEAEAARVAPVAGAIDLAALNFRYRIAGDKAAWRPVRAFDDSRQLIIEFGEDIATGDMPPLFVIGGSGEAELVNYRVQGRYMIVDRLFERGELRLGAGKQARVVRIKREMPRRRGRS